MNLLQNEIDVEQQIEKRIVVMMTEQAVTVKNRRIKSRNVVVCMLYETESKDSHRFCTTVSHG